MKINIVLNVTITKLSKNEYVCDIQRIGMSEDKTSMRVFTRTYVTKHWWVNLMLDVINRGWYHEKIGDSLTFYNNTCYRPTLVDEISVWIE